MLISVSFDELSYLSHLENSILKDVIKIGIVKSLQKYLSATGLSKDGIQDSLDITVTKWKFNNVSVRGALVLNAHRLWQNQTL